ncbi:MAG: lipopolysaccharide biosynthesis protein [Rubripirellula sp.]
MSSQSDSKTSFVADSLATGMLVMLAMTVVQRALGFARGIWFCRVLDDAVVGQWAMAYDFIIMVTPVMLLGMPGTLPRYVEHFRINGHLSAFVRRLLVATVVLGALFYASILAMPNLMGWLVFDNAGSVGMVYGVGAGVLSIVAFNFVHQLVSSLRQVRVASLMQFVQSVGFTGLGVGWLMFGGGVTGLIYAFSVATLLAILPGAWSLMSGWRGLPTSEEPFQAGSMWRRILPFAIALWAMNLLTNVFALSDRYMILHLLPGGELDGQAAVGQYHSSRIVPTLLMSIASIVAGVLMPYLSADWEAGRRDEVRQSLRRMLFGVSAGFTVCGAIGLLVAPWFFGEILENRYDDGLSLLPMAFVFSIWVSVVGIAQNYLWVAEKGKWVAVAIGFGLFVNVGLNLALLPMMGLKGAVLATLAANGVVMVGLWYAMSRHGYALDRTTFYITILPATLLANPWIAVVCVLVSCIANPQTKAWCIEAIDHGKRRLKFA